MVSERFTPRNVTSVFLALMLTVFLLAVGSGGYTSITRFKFGLMVILCGLYFIAMAASFVFCRVKGISVVRPRWDASRLCILLFFLFCAISAVISPYFPDTLIGFHRYEGLLTIACYVLMFLLISWYGEVRPWLLWVFAAAMTAFCLLCIVQFLGYNPFTLYPEGLNYYDGNDAYRYEFLGTVGNVGLVAAILAVAAPTFAVALVRLKGKRRFLLLIPLVLVLFVTVCAKVAAGYVAVFGGLFLLLPLAMVTDRRKKKLILLLFLVLAVFGLLFLYCVDVGGGTLHEVHALLHGEWDDKFGTSRLFIWRNVLALVPDRPMFGGGPDTLGERMEVEFRRYDAEKEILFKAKIDTAHNEYLNILVNEGALAFLAYMAALFFSFAAFLKENPRNTAAAICGSAVFGYCIQAFFGLRMCITSPFFWIAWALLLSAIGMKKEKDLP